MKFRQGLTDQGEKGVKKQRGRIKVRPGADELGGRERGRDSADRSKVPPGADGPGGAADVRVHPLACPANHQGQKPPSVQRAAFVNTQVTATYL